MRILILALAVLLIGLQYRLWVGEGSLADIRKLDREISRQSAENQRLQAENDRLAAKVADLKEGYVGIEGRARSSLGLVKDGETYFMFVDKQD